MIPTGLNGRTEGLYLVNELLAKKKITVPESELTFQDGRHQLKGVVFSESLREDPELSAALQDVTEDLVRLYYEVEKDDRLQVRKDRIGGTLRPFIGNEDLTGMTFLNLFADRFITLEEQEDGTVAFHAIPLIYKELPNAQTLIGALIEDIKAFSGRIGSFSGAEDPQELSEKEENVRKNVTGTLKILHNMMEELDEETDLVRAEDVLSSLSFTQGTYIDVGNVRVQIPDSFRVEKDTDGHQAILYRPNEENPEVYESSGLVYYLDSDETGKTVISASARVEEARREETEKQLVSRLWGHAFLKS